MEIPAKGFAEVPGGQVAYSFTGTEQSGTPLLVLHGGPGCTSDYLAPLALPGGRPVVFYDQLGCGNSDCPADSSLWTLERAVNELAAVREALGLDHVHILGQGRRKGRPRSMLMEPDHTLPADSTALARIIAALANSGGGSVFVRGDPATVRVALMDALREIVPMPTIPGEVAAPRPAHQGIARPAEVSVRQMGGKSGLLVTIAPGASLCTVDGTVLVFEDGAVRPLSLTEVVRRAGSGG